MGRRAMELLWAVIVLDLMEFLKSKSQHTYLAVLQDLFTRCIAVKPLRSTAGRNVTATLEELILLRRIIESVKSLYRTTQSCPVERSNRTLKTMIAMFVVNDHTNWDKQIHTFRHAINTAKQSSTKTSSAFLNMVVMRNRQKVFGEKSKTED